MPEPGEVPDDVYNDFCEEVDASRRQMAFNMEMAWETAPEENEPLMSAIGTARRRKEQAESEIRRLVACGREFTRPRPCKLADLAGMSVSGVRTAYGHGDVAAVEQATGRKPREWRATSPDDRPPPGAKDEADA